MLYNKDISLLNQDTSFIPMLFNEIDLSESNLKKVQIIKKHFSLSHTIITNTGKWQKVSPRKLLYISGKYVQLVYLDEIRLKEIIGYILNHEKIKTITT